MNGSSSRRWCAAWDAASEALLRELKDVRPVDAEVRRYIDERQRLTTSNPKPKDDDVWPEREQRAWLERAVAREAVIRRAYARYEVVVTQSVETHRSGARVRATFGDKAEARPMRVSRKV